MEQLERLLNQLLAEQFALYSKTQYFHWNVTGPDFIEYHNFLGELYEEIYSSIDPTAEQIRAIDGTPHPLGSSLTLDYSSIKPENSVPPAMMMFVILFQDNNKIIETLNKCFKAATNLDKQGLADYIAGRLDTHAKHRWMLKSFTPATTSGNRNEEVEETVVRYEIKPGVEDGNQ